MSIIEMPNWIRRKRQYAQQNEHYEHRDPRPYKLPEDMMADLDRALIDERGQPPLGTPSPKPRTAAAIAQQLEHLREDLTDARAVVKQGEEKEAALVIELAKAVDEEIALKKATHDTEVAELQALRPATGESA
jgi:hypothetical protein